METTLFKMREKLLSESLRENPENPEAFRKSPGISGISPEISDFPLKSENSGNFQAFPKNRGISFNKFPISKF